MPISLFEAVVFGALQGVTELFPVSSLGHSVILPGLVGWDIKQDDPFFLTFLVATHAATAFVLFLFFWKDWKLVISGFFRSYRTRRISDDDTYAKLSWLLVVGTIPAGILGLLFEEHLKVLFAAPTLVAFVLILNGVLLYLAEILRRRRKDQSSDKMDQRVAKLTFLQALEVGTLQCLALIPGFSRTGSSITGGLLVGLSHEDAARFSFLMATPIIGAAAVLKLPELSLSNQQSAILPSIVGAMSSGFFAYLSVKFLTKYFKTKTLTPFAVYCALIGILASLVFFLR